MPSIRISSPRELNLPKGVQFWPPNRDNPRTFKIEHIRIRTCPNPDVVEVRLYDSPDGEVQEVFHAQLGRSVIKRIMPRRLGKAGS